MLIKEIKKIFKLKSFRYLIVFNIIFIIIFLFKEESKSNFFSYYINVILDVSNVVFFYNIFICVIIGEIISDEIHTGSIYYLIIKQKNIRKVLEIKTISCILLTFSILAFNIFSISMFGLFTKEIEPLVVLGNVNEVILKDDCINESIFRITFFNINLLFGIVIITLLSVIVSIFARNKISSIISSFIVIMIATYPINIKGKVYSLIFYKLPLIKLYIPITDYVKYITSNIVIYILVIFILSLFVNLSWRLRNEL